MRLLFIPNFTKGLSSEKMSPNSVITDSGFKILQDIRNSIGNRAYCYWILPSQLDGIGMEKVMGDRDHCFYESQCVDNFYYRDTYVDSELLKKFSRRFGDYLADAIVTTRRGAVYEMSKLTDTTRLGENSKNKDDVKKINMPIVFIEPNAWEYDNNFDVVSAMCYYLAYPVFLSDVEKKKALRITSEYVSGRVLKAIDNRARVGFSVFQFERMDKIKTQSRKSDEFVTIFYGQRMNKYKRTKFIFDIYAKLFAMYGDKINVVATTQNGLTGISEQTEEEKWGKFYHLVPNCDWETYIGYANMSHVALVASVSEALSSAHIEQIYMGVIMVLPKKDWAMEYVPEDYPFFYNGASECLGIMQYIIENYEEAYRKFEPAIDFVRTKFSDVTKTLDAVIVDIVLESREALMDEYRSAMNNKRGLLSRALGLKSEISWADFVRGLANNSPTISGKQSIEFRRMNTISDYEAYVALQSIMGCHDTLTHEMPIIINEGEKE